MKISYVSAYDAQDVRSWSGTPYHMSQALSQIANDVEYIGSLKVPLSSKVLFRAKQVFYKFLAGKRYIRDADLPTLKQFARQIDSRLSQSRSDVVISPTSYTLAYLKSKQPLVFWADATFAELIDYYPFHTNLCKESIRNGLAMEQAVFDKCKLAIFSSDWAANSALRNYRIDSAKVQVVSYGANIDCQRTLADIRESAQARPSNCCKLLFMGVNWQRKGGNIAVDVATALNQAGLKTELTLAGCQPPVDKPLPEFVRSLGFISKSTSAGRDQINRLFQESHFLILPSQADCTPMVLAEANSFGLPCLSTHVGGIPSMIQDQANGKLFAADANVSDYCDYVLTCFDDYSRYLKLAESAFTEYQARLNWTVSARKVKQLIQTAA
jgi:glycosyltransferase involved in cell wall biosynthesis